MACQAGDIWSDVPNHIVRKGKGVTRRYAQLDECELEAVSSTVTTLPVRRASALEHIEDDPFDSFPLKRACQSPQTPSAASREATARQIQEAIASESRSPVPRVQSQFQDTMSRTMVDTTGPGARREAAVTQMQPKVLSRFDYRADVDGLRAVAVLSVMTYHMEKSWLPGGFTGVVRG